MEPLRRPSGSPDGGFNYGEFASLMARDWMASPGHRANMLKSSFTLSGCAAQVSHALPANQRVFAVQVFCQPDTNEPTAQKRTPAGSSVLNPLASPR